MVPWWPWRRASGAEQTEEAPPTPAAPPSSHPPVPAGWRTVPALQRTAPSLEPIAPLDAFTGGLRTHRSPGLLGAMGHVVSADAPSGVVAGLARTGAPVQRVPDGELVLGASVADPATEQRHDRSTALPRTRTGTEVPVTDAVRASTGDPSSSPPEAVDTAGPDPTVAPTGAPSPSAVLSRLPASPVGELPHGRPLTLPVVSRAAEPGSPVPPGERAPQLPVRGIGPAPQDASPHVRPPERTAPAESPPVPLPEIPVSEEPPSTPAPDVAPPEGPAPTSVPDLAPPEGPAPTPSPDLAPPLGLPAPHRADSLLQRAAQGPSPVPDTGPTTSLPTTGASTTGVSAGRVPAEATAPPGTPTRPVAEHLPTPAPPVQRTDATPVVPSAQTPDPHPAPAETRLAPPSSTPTGASTGALPPTEAVARPTVMPPLVQRTRADAPSGSPTGAPAGRPEPPGRPILLSTTVPTAPTGPPAHGSTPQADGPPAIAPLVARAPMLEGRTEAPEPGAVDALPVTPGVADGGHAVIPPGAPLVRRDPVLPLPATPERASAAGPSVRAAVQRQVVGTARPRGRIGMPTTAPVPPDTSAPAWLPTPTSRPAPTSLPAPASHPVPRSHSTPASHPAPASHPEPGSLPAPASPAEPLRRTALPATETVLPLQRMFGSPAPVASDDAEPRPTTSSADGVPASAAEAVPVQRQAADQPPAPDATAGATVTPAAQPGPPTTVTAPPDIDELVDRLYEPLSARLRTELWLDRERAGHLIDLRQ